MRETLFLRSQYLTTLTDNFVSGDQATITGGDGCVTTSSGFVRIDDPRKSGFDAVFVSDLSPGQSLTLQRLGHAPTSITPHWTQRAQADRDLVTIGGIFVGVATIVGLFSLLGQRPTDPERTRMEQVPTELELGNDAGPSNMNDIEQVRISHGEDRDAEGSSDLNR